MRREEAAGLIHSVASLVICGIIWQRTGLVFTAMVAFACSQVGLLRFFPFFYALYCNRITGLWLSRHLLHPRQDQAHSNFKLCQAMQGVEVLPVPVLRDNYAYLAYCTETRKAIIVDPGDPRPLLTIAREMQVTVEAVLVTHKHWDHCEGAVELREGLPGRPDVIGSEQDAPHGMTRAVADGDEIAVGQLRVVAREVPGHTTHHLVFVLRHAQLSGPGAVFSGDSLFCGGCGAFFEADTPGLRKAHSVYAAMPGDTLVFPGHEYTEMLLRKELGRDPANEHIQQALDRAVAQREQKNPTVPSTLEEQRRVNPFLRLSAEFFAEAVRKAQHPDVVLMEMSRQLSVAPAGPQAAPRSGSAAAGSSSSG
eukprot:TRINITY_DN12668_c0_g1_i1.p1 TRINITY_DN12668_c0_g1~~TRINITY_DN12668_c0_g1_i1.p1  ORF type:complete len:392 (+),score=123.38 TRINITY_DN12668_c0_g1_i1:81-1178(+)